MATYYVGEIRWFPYDFAPLNWLDCHGQTLSIVEYEPLYYAIGLTYGGDGVSTFQLPDLRGRVPVHRGTGPGLTNRALGQTGGSEAVTLSSAQMPVHTHTLVASGALADRASPTGGVPGTLALGEAMYVTTPGSGTVVTMGNALGIAGGSLPHDNLAPTLTLRPCIAVDGIYPPRDL